MNRAVHCFVFLCVLCVTHQVVVFLMSVILFATMVCDCFGLRLRNVSAARESDMAGLGRRRLLWECVWGKLGVAFSALVYTVGALAPFACGSPWLNYPLYRHVASSRICVLLLGYAGMLEPTWFTRHAHFSYSVLNWMTVTVQGNWPGARPNPFKPARPDLIIPSDSFVLFCHTEPSHHEWGWKFFMTAGSFKGLASSGPSIPGVGPFWAFWPRCVRVSEVICERYL